MLDMAPGTSTMLRARRRDINVKPNRRLDRKSSRGMLYENEELRLRTININAEVEKGQNDIKKLRRENEHLRREIWGLRDEYDRLEGLLGKLKKSKRRGSQGDEEEYDDEDEDEEYDEEEEEEDEEEADEHTENAAQENAENLQKVTSNLRVGFDGLSVVDEETEENQTPNGSVEPPYRGTITLPDGRQGVYLSDAMPPRRKVNVPGPTPAEQKSLVEQWGYAIPRGGPDIFVTGGFPTGGNLDQLLQEVCPGQSQKQEVEQVEVLQEAREVQKSTTVALQRGEKETENVNQAAITTASCPESPANKDNNSECNQEDVSNDNRPCSLAFTNWWSDLTVQEVIDALEEKLGSASLDEVRGVRVTSTPPHCVVCLSQQEDVTSLLDSGLVLRGQHHDLRPIPREPLVLLLTGVPHHVTDGAIALLASNFGVLIGEVERRLYKGVDTGKRILRLRPNSDCEHIPTHVVLGGSKVSVKILPQDDVTGQNSSDSRYKSQISVRLRPADPVPVPPETIVAPPITPPPPAFFAPIPVPIVEPIINPFNPEFHNTTPEHNISVTGNPFVFPNTVNEPIPIIPVNEVVHDVSSTPQNPTSSESPAQGRRQKQTKKTSRSRKTSGETSDVPNAIGTPNKSNNRKISLNVSDSRSSSSGPDSPRRRRVSVYFNRKGGGGGRRDSGVVPNGGVTELSDRERTNSVSSRTSSAGGGASGGKRKLSAIEREKVPWCGCWGNGCI